MKPSKTYETKAEAKTSCGYCGWELDSCNDCGNKFRSGDIVHCCEDSDNQYCNECKSKETERQERGK
jgi:hypothetical protein